MCWVLWWIYYDEIQNISESYLSCRSIHNRYIKLTGIQKNVSQVENTWLCNCILFVRLPLLQVQKEEELRGVLCFGFILFVYCVYPCQSSPSSESNTIRNSRAKPQKVMSSADNLIHDQKDPPRFSVLAME